MTNLYPAATPAKYGNILSAYTGAFLTGGINGVKQVLATGGHHRVFRNGAGPYSILDAVQMEFLSRAENVVALRGKLDELLAGAPNQPPGNVFAVWKYGASAATAACRPAYLIGTTKMFEDKTSNRAHGGQNIVTIVPTHDVVEFVMFSDLKGATVTLAQIASYEQNSGDPDAAMDAARARLVI